MINIKYKQVPKNQSVVLLKLNATIGVLKTFEQPEFMNSV